MGLSPELMFVFNSVPLPNDSPLPERVVSIDDRVSGPLGSPVSSHSQFHDSPFGSDFFWYVLHWHERNRDRPDWGVLTNVSPLFYNRNLSFRECGTRQLKGRRVDRRPRGTSGRLEWNCFVLTQWGCRVRWRGSPPTTNTLRRLLEQVEFNTLCPMTTPHVSDEPHQDENKLIVYKYITTLT